MSWGDNVFAKLYRVKDKLTGMKHCSTKKPVAGDYFYSGTVKAESPDKVFTLLKMLSRAENAPKTALPLKPGDVIVLEGYAYMAVKDGWTTVSFNEKEAYI